MNGVFNLVKNLEIFEGFFHGTFYIVEATKFYRRFNLNLWLNRLNQDLQSRKKKEGLMQIENRFLDSTPS